MNKSDPNEHAAFLAPIAAWACAGGGCQAMLAATVEITVTVLGIAVMNEMADDKESPEDLLGNVREKDFAKSPPNPYGVKGKPDHQQKVKELAQQAEDEALPGQEVVTEQGVRGFDTNRKPDVQIRDIETRKTISIKEAERNPLGKRNKSREKEYDALGIKNGTYGVGKGQKRRTRQRRAYRHEQ